MYKLLALIVILAVAVSSHPAVDPAGVQAPKGLALDAKADGATKNVEADLDGGDAGDGSDLKGSETIGIGFYSYPVVHYGPHYGYGGYGGYGGWGGYGHGGWGWGGYNGPYYW